MSGMYGADVEHLRALARRFDSAAAQLDQTRAGLGGQIQTIPWQGSDAQRFRAAWQSDYASRISRAVIALREGASVLRKDADEQENTSAVVGGTRSGGTSPVSGGMPLPGIFPPLPRAKFPPDNLVPFPFDWSSSEPDGSGFLRIHPPGFDGSDTDFSPYLLQPDWLGRPTVQPLPPDAGDVYRGAESLPGPNLVNPLADFLNMKPAKGTPVLDSFDTQFFLSKIPGAGDIFTGIGIGNTLIDPQASFTNKAFGVTGGLVDLASSVLKKTGIGYLPGVAAAQVWDVFDQARRIDFSPSATQTTFDYIRKNPWDAVVAGSEAVVGYVPRLIDNFWP